MAPPLFFLVTGLVLLLASLIAGSFGLASWVEHLVPWGWLIASASVIAWLIARDPKITCPRCGSDCNVFPWSW